MGRQIYIIKNQKHLQMFLFLFTIFNRLIPSIPALAELAVLSHN